MVGNHKCKSTRHPMHLCALRACDLNEQNDDVFAKLVDNPQFECEDCGDKANNADNLCKPKKIQA